MSSSSLAKQVLFSLPPLAKDDQSTILETIEKQVPGYKSSYVEEWKARQCLDEENAKTPFAESLLVELQTQMDKQYGSQRSTQFQARFAVVPAKGSKNNNDLVIRTYVEICEPHKFRGGFWSTEWTYNGSSGGGSTVSGTIAMQVHSYEDGINVQLRATREVPDQSLSSDDSAALVQHVQRTTQAFYDTMVDHITGDQGRLANSLKKVRRILPITKTRMKWDDAAQEQIRLLNDSKAQKPKKKTFKVAKK